MNNISNGDTEQADYHFLKKSSESDTLLREKLLQFLLVGCSIVPPQSMMPLAPTMTELPTAHKPKIGFSIDSIVGGGGDTSKGEDTSALLRSSNSNRSRRSSSVDNDRDREHESISPKRESISPELAEKPGGMAALLMKGTRGDVLAPLSHHHHHLHRLASSFPHHAQQALLSAENGNNGSMSPPIPGGMLYHPLHHPHPLRLPLLHAHHSPSLGSNHSSTSHSPPGRVSPTSSTSNNNNNNNNDSIISRVGNNGEKEGLLNSNPSSRSPSPASSSHQVRSPSPNQKSAAVSATATSGVGAEISSASPHPEIHHPLVNAGSHHHPRPGLPPGLHPPHPPVGPHGIPPFAAYPPGMLNFAAAAAVAAQAQHHPGLPSWMGQPPHPGGPPHHPPHPAAAAHPLYPWLLAKHSRLFPHRFGPGPDLPGFLFQPFRKPKRIRTAFSPSQLLKLEHAFEKNHYVVGAERKQLAKSLSLSETQVKVWFQNRRTKHKRVEQEEDVMKKSDGSSRASGNSSGSDLPSSGRGDLSTSSISADSSTRNYSEVSDDEEIVMDDEYSDDEEMERQQEHAANMLHNHHHLSKSYS